MASPSPPALKDQYHHSIPRFILRRFQAPVKPEPVTSPKRRSNRRKVPQEYLYFYDVKTRNVELRAIATVYGVTNLYKDVRSSHDIMEIENKLSILEGKAAQVIILIHKTIGVSPTVRLRRGELEDLRRFLFVMHYRNPAVSVTYFDEHHPDNARGHNGWIKTYREKHGLASAADMWLHVLRYYLDEPHEQMVAEFNKALEKYGVRFNDLLVASPPDPTVKIEALAYGMQASAYYLVIWEAADEEEFLLTQSSFGLWEGLFMGEPSLHRVFVVSPRIAVILRHHPLNLPREHCVSGLIDIPATLAVAQYGSLPFDDAERLSQYRTSPQGRADVFTFTKTKLTPAQTDSVNAVLLQNVRPDGSITFLSPQPALRTLRKYMSAPGPQSILTGHMLTGLMERLADLSLLPTAPTLPPRAPPYDPANITPLPSEGFKYHFPGEERTHPLRDRLRELIYADLAGVAEFKSRYGTAYAIYRLCEHDDMPASPFLFEQRAFAATAYDLLSTTFAPPPFGSRPRPETLLVRDLPEKQSVAFFTTLETLCKLLGFGDAEEISWLEKLMRHVALVGLAERLAQMRPDAFATISKKLPTNILR